MWSAGVEIINSSAPIDTPRIGKVRCLSPHGFHNVAYRDWGGRAQENHLFCVHGLTRNSQDFDFLASQFRDWGRVVCMDLPGRGASDWLKNSRDYHLAQYNADANTVTEAVGLTHFDWLGTSLGGLMGIALAGLDNSPIRRLIINDVGPEIPLTALRRITSYVAHQNTFDDLEQVEGHLRNTLSPFGPMTDENWQRMAVTSSVPMEGGYRMHHDPGIMDNFRAYFMFTHFNLWRFWDRIKCPVLILRGATSDFLTERISRRMLTRLPGAQMVEYEGVGHTPTLNAAWQVDPIRDWLQETAEMAGSAP